MKEWLLVLSLAGGLPHYVFEEGGVYSSIEECWAAEENMRWEDKRPPEFSSYPLANEELIEQCISRENFEKEGFEYWERRKQEEYSTLSDGLIPSRVWLAPIRFLDH